MTRGPGTTNITMADRPEHGARLEPLSGPALAVVILRGDGVERLGRSRECEHCLPDPAVSRFHASVQHRGERWLLSDEHSRHGTYLNGVRLSPGDPTPLNEGDLIGLGPWSFQYTAAAPQAHHGEASGTRPGLGTRIATVVKQPGRGEVVERLEERHLGYLAQHRLKLLIECAASIHAAEDERALAVAVTESAVAGSGFMRAALLRTRPGWDPASGSAGDSAAVDVLAAVVGRGRAAAARAADFPVSASLIAEASSGRPARLGGFAGAAATPDYGQSIADLEIHTALCVPLEIGDRIDAYLYLDARGGESVVESDAAEFCVALARIGGLAMANRRREELEARQKALVAQLGAAREAQQLILPSPSGTIAGVTYSLRMRPGMYVAGDLFDIMPLADGRAAFFLGDVTGEGVSAGILMASAQSHLHALLLQHADPEKAVNTVNRYLAEHTPPDRFISLWVGILDRTARELTFVDAGHGYCFRVPHGGTPERISAPTGGIPAAIEPEFVYGAHTMAFEPGDRLVLFSDGVVEQTPQGEQPSDQEIDMPTQDGAAPSRAERDEFGLGRVGDVLARCGSPEEDTRKLLAAVLDFAGTEALGDDTTIASLAWNPQTDA